MKTRHTCIGYMNYCKCFILFFFFYSWIQHNWNKIEQIFTQIPKCNLTCNQELFPFKYLFFFTHLISICRNFPKSQCFGLSTEEDGGKNDIQINLCINVFIMTRTLYSIWVYSQNYLKYIRIIYQMWQKNAKGKRIDPVKRLKSILILCIYYSIQ